MGLYDQIKTAFQDVIAPELHVLRGDIQRLDQKIDQKIVSLDQKIDQKIMSLDQKIDQKIVSLDQKIDAVDARLGI
jgi:hypothetical protein